MSLNGGGVVWMGECEMGRGGGGDGDLLLRRCMEK